MLYVINMTSQPELGYRGGQKSIVHLEADLHRSVAWAKANGRRWAFASSSAGSYYFDDYADPSELNKLDWQAIQASDWQQCRDEKQAEFLVEGSFPWKLKSGIGGTLPPNASQSATDAQGVKPSPDGDDRTGLVLLTQEGWHDRALGW